MSSRGPEVSRVSYSGRSGYMAENHRQEGSPKVPQWIAAYRHDGGGLSYLAGRTPRVEPTAYAMLAGVADDSDVHWLRGEWSRSLVARDGVSPKAAGATAQRELTQHPWLLALATVALACDPTSPPVPDTALRDVVDRLGGHDVRSDFERLTGKDEPELEGALPWRTPSYGWVEPTSWGLMAEASLLAADLPIESERRLIETVPKRVAFLLSRVTKDGAWNYGSVTILGVDVAAMPQTSAVCLTALAAASRAAAKRGIELPEFRPAAPIARLRELDELEPSRLARVWTQLAMLSWQPSARLPDVPTHGPRPGESFVDAVLTLLLARAKREGVVPMVGVNASGLAASSSSPVEATA